MITFSQDKPIYLQMADRLSDDILACKYGDDERIPSVREYAADMQVNTNTAVKAFDELSRQNIIYNRRGMGFYVTAGARSRIQEQRRKEFREQTLTRIFREMDLLGIGIEDVVEAYKNERMKK